MADTTGGNGSSRVLPVCSWNASHVFTTEDARMSHEPSCPDNPSRVDESENPER